VPYLELGRSGGLSASDKVRAAARMFANRDARRRFARLLDDTRPSLVHIHGIHRQISPSILLEALARGIPVVQTLHDHHHICPADVLIRSGAEPCQPRRCGTFDYLPCVTGRCVRGSLAASTLSAAEVTWQRMRRIYERTVVRFISPSRFVAEKAREGGWTIPTDVVPNAVELPPRGQVPHAGRQGSSRHILVAGRLSPEKDVRTALRAAEIAGVDVLVAGDGPQGAELRAEFPGVDFRGHVSHGEVARMLPESVASVVSSRWYENAPLSVLEAMAAGRPVIASRTGGIPEMLRDGRDGILVTPGDVDGFAAAMRELVSNPSKADAMGASALERARAEYSLERHMGRLLAAYARATTADSATRGSE
jgi:glycosyltransferase involved in cell wall biosynthesis